MNLSDIATGQKLNVLSRDGTNKIKVVVGKINKREKSVEVVREDNDKAFTVSDLSRFSRRQGRPPVTQAAPAQKPAKATAKPVAKPAKATAKPKQEEEGDSEGPDFVAITEEIESVREVMTELTDRLTKLAEIVSSIQASEVEEDEVAAPKAAKANKGRAMVEDESD